MWKGRHYLGGGDCKNKYWVWRPWIDIRGLEGVQHCCHLLHTIHNTKDIFASLKSIFPICAHLMKATTVPVTYQLLILGHCSGGIKDEVTWSTCLVRGFLNGRIDPILALIRLQKGYSNSDVKMVLGGMHLVRTHAARGRGGLGHEYVRKINCLAWTFAKKFGIVESIFVTF